VQKTAIYVAYCGNKQEKQTIIKKCSLLQLQAKTKQDNTGCWERQNNNNNQPNNDSNNKGNKDKTDKEEYDNNDKDDNEVEEEQEGK